MLRHLLAIVALPVTVMILVPAWIARRYAVHAAAPSTVAEGLLLIPGFGFLSAGLVLFSACLFGFATRGRGTLAPGGGKASPRADERCVLLSVIETRDTAKDAD